MPTVGVDARLAITESVWTPDDRAVAQLAGLDQVMPYEIPDARALAKGHEERALENPSTHGALPEDVRGRGQGSE